MRCILPVVMLILPVSLLAQPRKLQADHSIQAVTVFSSGAQVLRAATVPLAAGRTEISFTGLSNQLDQQSVQLQADAGITLLSVQTVKDHFRQRRIEQDEAQLLERKAILAEKLETENRLLQVYRNEEAMLIKNQSIGGQAGVKPADLRLALDLQRQRLSEVYQVQMEIEKRIRVLQAEITRINAQLPEISRKKDSVNYTVVATIESKETRPVRFRLLYTVQDAGWYPTYDVRITDVTRPLSVMMNANVYQRSGEEWKDVSLELSTGNPKDNATPTELQPWMLGFYDPSVSWMKSQTAVNGIISGRVTNENGEPLPSVAVQIKGERLGTTTDANGFFRLQATRANGTLVISAVGHRTKEMAMKPGYYSVVLQSDVAQLQEVVVVGVSSAAAEHDMPVARRKQQVEIQPVTTVTEYRPTTTTYRIEEKYTIETDGKTVTIAIRRSDISAQYEYVAAPKADPSAFLTAGIVNWEEHDLQPGEANLYFEGSYLGKTYLDLSDVADTLELALGKDHGIRISRKLLREFSARKLIGSNRTDTREFEITVRNNKKVPVTIVVTDQVPVSVTKEIEVDHVKFAEGEYDKASGLITWRLTLQPGQEKKLFAGYSVKYPKDRRIVLE